MSGRSLVRTIGRGAIWATLALLLLRGVGSVFSPASSEVARPQKDTSAEDQIADAFAVRFARAYLSEPSAEALAPYMAEGAHIGTGLAPKVETASVAQAEVSGTEDLGDGESVLTVACELRDSRTLYLAVPLARSGTGEVAALGAPWIVAGPGTTAGAESERPRPLAGADAPEIESLVSKFLPAYLASGAADELSYLLLPGEVIQPLGGQARAQEPGRCLPARRRRRAAPDDPRRGPGHRPVRRGDLPARLPPLRRAVRAGRPLVRRGDRGGVRMIRRTLVFLLALAWMLAVGLVAGSVALAAGNDVALNLGELLRKSAGEIYGGVVALFALPFLFTRRFTELGLYFVAAIVVGWLVFSPDQVANAARAIAGQVLP